MKLVGGSIIERTLGAKIMEEVLLRIPKVEGEDERKNEERELLFDHLFDEAMERGGYHA